VKRFRVHVPKSDGVILFCYFTIRCLYKIQIPHPPLLIRFKHFGIGHASYETYWRFTFCGQASEINEKGKGVSFVSIPKRGKDFD
jgi:hypothetical protein